MLKSKNDFKKMGQFAKDLYTRVPQLEVFQATGSLPEVGRATKVQKRMSRTLQQFKLFKQVK